MITDYNLRVSTDQSLLLNATSDLSTGSIDLSVARDVGEGKELFFNFAITASVASAATSVTFEIVGADNAALSTNLVVFASSGAIAYGSLTAGTNLALPIPPRVASLGKRYLGVRYTTAGDNHAGTGTVTADVVETIQDGKKFYASGFSIE